LGVIKVALHNGDDQVNLAQKTINQSFFPVAPNIVHCALPQIRLFAFEKFAITAF